MGKHGGNKKVKLTKDEKRAKIEAETVQKATELQEIDGRLRNLHHQQMKIDARIASYERSERLTQLLATEFGQEGLGYENAKFYAHCGRAFILSDRDTMFSDLKIKSEEAKRNLPQLRVISSQFNDKLKGEAQQMAQLRRDFARLGLLHNAHT